MKHDIEKALQTIPVPDLANEVQAGIARAERNRITMTRSVKKIAAIAAALVLCVGTVGTAAVIGSNRGDVIVSDKAITLNFTGFDANSGEATASGEYEGETGLKAMRLGNYTITDENGEEYTSQINMWSYWADENGDLHFVLIPLGMYKVEVDSVYDENGKEIFGHWELDFDFSTWPYDCFFDPRGNYHGSVEEGTAYVADEKEISLAFVDNGDGRKRLDITVDSDAEALKDISKIYVANFVFFDENRQFLGGGGGGDFINPSVGIGGDFNFGDEFEWGDLNIRGGVVYWEDKGANLGKICTLKIYSFAVERSDGSRIEIQGDWEVDFTV